MTFCFYSSSILLLLSTGFFHPSCLVFGCRRSFRRSLHPLHFIGFAVCSSSLGPSLVAILRACDTRLSRCLLREVVGLSGSLPSHGYFADSLVYLSLFFPLIFPLVDQWLICNSQPHTSPSATIHDKIE
ncbi:hypothetical protein C8J56DRAFT_965968 [Mycena floridula]|nr:hypothetical protein C8J56DRAFT_965968 [Mycena floridula]